MLLLMEQEGYFPSVLAQSSEAVSGLPSSGLEPCESLFSHRLSPGKKLP